MRNLRPFLLSLLISFVSIFVIWGFQCGCGTAGTSSGGGGGVTGGGGGGGSGVGISGSVEAPTSVTTSVSLGASVSKGLGQGNSNKVIVSKEVVDQPVSGGEVTITDTAGEVLDKCSVSSSGTLQGCDCDPSKLEADKQVIVKVDTSGGSVDLATMVDLTGKAAGDSAAAGTINVDKTLAVNQAISQCGSAATLDNISACASVLGVKLDALFKTFSGTSGTSASVSNTAGVQEAYKKMVRAAIAAGTPPNPAEWISMINGDTSVINKFKGFDSTVAGLDVSAMADVMKNFPVACKGYFNDSTLYNNYKKGGDDAFSKGAADFFKNLKSSDLTKIQAEPALYQNLMGQYASDFASGNANAFKNFGQPDFARTMAGLGGHLDPTDFTDSSKTAAYKKLLDGGTWQGTGDPSKLAEAFANQYKAADKQSEWDSWNSNAGAFFQKAYDKPDAFTGTAGITAFDNQFITFVQDPTGFAAGGGCSVDADCSSGQECSPFKFCRAVCTSGCLAGDRCTSNGECASGFCDSNGACFVDTTIAGFDPYVIKKASGESCTANTECGSGNCSGGSCQASTVGGGAAPPPTAGGLTATAGNGSVTLSWTAVSGASSYKVYRATATGVTVGSTLVTSSVTTNSYPNTGLINGTTYYYKILAVSSTGESTLSNEVSATPSLGVSVPSAPTNLDSEAQGSQIVLTWTKVTGATGYKVYRKGTTGVVTTDTLVTTTGDVATYTNSGLTNGNSYYYKIAATNSAGDSVALSSEVSGIPGTADSVKGVTAAAEVTPLDILLNWTNTLTSDDGGRYCVHYKSSAGVTATDSLVTDLGIASTNTSYTVDGGTLSFVAGTRYYFRIRSATSCITSGGALSKEVSAVAP